MPAARHVALALAAALVCLGAHGCGRRDAGRSGVASLARVPVDQKPPFVAPTARGASAWKDTRRFYARRDQRPAWLADPASTSAFDQLLETALRAPEHGLAPADYDVEALQAERQALAVHWPARVDPARLVTLDTRLTYTFLRLARDLWQGRIDPGTVSPGFLGSTPPVDLVAQLEVALASDQVSATLASLAPTHGQYEWLQQALPRYRTASDAAPGDAVAAWRVRQIEMNMERWRWVPRALGARHLLVNVPAYALQAIEGSRPVLAMRVVVGDPKSPTPLFSDRMTYVVFSPYWNIPESILRAETLAQAAGDPTFFSRAGIELVRTRGPEVERVDPATLDWSTDPVTQGVRFRQVPGPDNALGRVKFIFPNHFDVYLHDTPNRAAFERSQRAYSHGCVRVEDPVALAEYVLRDQPDWTRARIVEAMDTRDETVARLSTPVPVHLGYWTTWVEPDGTLTFTDDPYGLDARHDRALTRAGRAAGSLRPEYATAPSRRPE